MTRGEYCIYFVVTSRLKWHIWKLNRSRKHFYIFSYTLSFWYIHKNHNLNSTSKVQFDFRCVHLTMFYLYSLFSISVSLFFLSLSRFKVCLRVQICVLRYKWKRMPLQTSAFGNFIIQDDSEHRISYKGQNKLLGR